MNILEIIGMIFLKTEEQGLLLESQNKFVEVINLYEKST